MFFRIKKSGDRAYVQVVSGAPTISSPPAHLPRCFRLAPSSLTRCCSSARSTRTPTDRCRLRPSASVDRCCSAGSGIRLGIAAVLAELLKHRAFEFAVERAVFVANAAPAFCLRVGS